MKRFRIIRILWKRAASAPVSLAALTGMAFFYPVPANAVPPHHCNLKEQLAPLLADRSQESLAAELNGLRKDFNGGNQDGQALEASLQSYERLHSLDRRHAAVRGHGTLLRTLAGDASATEEVRRVAQEAIARFPHLKDSLLSEEGDASSIFALALTASPGERARALGILPPVYSDLAGKVEALGGAREVDEILSVLDAIKASGRSVSDRAMDYAFWGAVKKLRHLSLRDLPKVLARIPQDGGGEKLAVSAIARAYSGPAADLAQGIAALPNHVRSHYEVRHLLMTLSVLHPSEAVRSVALRSIDSDLAEGLADGSRANFGSFLAPIVGARSSLKDDTLIPRFVDYLSARLDDPHVRARESATDTLLRIARGKMNGAPFSIADRVRAVQALSAAVGKSMPSRVFGEFVELLGEAGSPPQIKSAVRAVLRPRDFTFVEALANLRSRHPRLRRAALKALGSREARRSPLEVVRRMSRFASGLDDRLGAGLSADVLSDIRAETLDFFMQMELRTVKGGGPDFAELLQSTDPKISALGETALMADRALEDPALVVGLLHEVKLEAAKFARKRGDLKRKGLAGITREDVIAVLVEKGRPFGLSGYHTIPETMLNPHEWAEQGLRPGKPFLDPFWTMQDHEEVTHWLQLLALARFKEKELRPIGGVPGFMREMADDMIRVENPVEEKGKSVWFRSFDQPKRKSMNSPDFFGPRLREFLPVN
jgi:hypothetical protein